MRSGFARALNRTATLEKLEKHKTLHAKRDDESRPGRHGLIIIGAPILGPFHSQLQLSNEKLDHRQRPIPHHYLAWNESEKNENKLAFFKLTIAGALLFSGQMRLA